MASNATPYANILIISGLPTTYVWASMLGWLENRRRTAYTGRSVSS